MKHFTSNTMLALLAKRVKGLGRGVALMARVAAAGERPGGGEGYWRAADLRDSGTSLTPTLRKLLLKAVTKDELLPFLTHASDNPEEAVLDVDYEVLKDELGDDLTGGTLVASLTKQLLQVDGLDSVSTAAILQAIEEHVRFHNAQALAMVCLRDILAIVSVTNENQISGEWREWHLPSAMVHLR